jgi:hypothetical protein
MAEEMILLPRTFDLLVWLLPKLEHFPKLYCLTITQRIMDAALDSQEALFEAQSQGGSTHGRHLRQADAALSKLRVYLRLVYHWLGEHLLSMQTVHILTTTFIPDQQQTFVYV